MPDDWHDNGDAAYADWWEIWNLTRDSHRPDQDERDRQGAESNQQ